MPYECFHICTETERRIKNVHELDFIFSVSVAEFQQIWQVFLIKSAHTQPLSNHEVIDGLSSETIVQLFYKHDTTDYKHLWGKTMTDYIKTMNLRQWHGTICIVKVFLLSERKYRHFLRFSPRIRFICERSAENETMQFGGHYGFGSDSVYMWNGP